MTNRLLHAVNIPEELLSNPSNEAQSKLASNSVLGGTASAEDIASEPTEKVLTGIAGGKFAKLTALELEELFTSDLIVPYTVRGRDDPQTDGYYATQNVDVQRAAASQDELQKFDGRLTKNGTQGKNWRAVRTNPQTLDNPFGSATAPEIGLSGRARKVRWFDDVAGTIEDATVQRTVEGEHDYLNIYDASEPSFDAPVLIYDIPYEEEYPTDCTVWDTYGRPKVYSVSTSTAQVGSATVGSATVGGYETYVASQWQRVYLADHDWVGDMILETDRLRLEIGQPEESVTAYRYDPDDGQYNLVQLGASDWRLWDVDIRTIGLAQIDAQFEFEDTSSGAHHNLNGTLVRGLDNVVWTVPNNEGSTPSGLIDRLDPIADDSDRVVNASADVVKRSEVDR